MKDDRATLGQGLRPGGFGCRMVPIKASWRRDFPARNLLHVRAEWVNRNVGRCFKDYQLHLYVTDSAGNVKLDCSKEAFDARSWVKGKTHPITSIIVVGKDLPAGDSDLRNTGSDESLRYKLGQIHIAPVARS